MCDRADCEILKAGWGDLSQGELEGGNWRDKEREREENKTQSNEIFTPFWINTWTILKSQLHGRGGRRNVEGQKEQWSFTVTWTNPLWRVQRGWQCHQGVTLSLWASCCSWGSLLQGPLTWRLSSAQKNKFWYDECENEGVFYYNRNLPHTLLSTAQGILWGFSECSLAQWLKNISIFLECP